jgi:hypothetical protein
MERGRLTAPMRRLLAPLLLLLAIAATAPAASASVPLPVAVRADTTLPGDDGCADCVGVEAGAAVFIPNCYDCPTVGVAVGASNEGKVGTVEARTCYSSFWAICFVDETVAV